MTDTVDNKKQSISRFSSLLNDLGRQFPQDSPQSSKQQKSVETLNVRRTLIVSVAEQRLYSIHNQVLDKHYTVSTAEAGTGNLSGSYQTPLGIHCIAEKVGANAAITSIFQGRKNTQNLARIIHDPKTRSEDDNITSRILWLKGLEEGLNQGYDNDNNKVDSYSRYIYIHGTDEEGLLGKPASHGCIRMANQDIIELFDNVNTNDLVVIISD